MSNTVMKPTNTSRWTRKAVRNAFHHKAPAASAEKVEALVAVVFAMLNASRSVKERKVEQVVEKLELGIALLLTDDAAPEDRSSQVSNIGMGKGLGPKLTIMEGNRRLAEYARAKPVEEWAGRVGNAGQIYADLGIPRTTLSVWRNAGILVGFKRDRRNYVYPFEQFLDGRPLDGLKEVLDVAPDARAAWLWLRQPHAAFDGARPIDRLREGLGEKVAAVAARTFA